MFIPPQLHNRFADLSKLCYDKRQEDKQYKTRISLGEEDLVLDTKAPGGQWESTDINSLGPISPPEWHKVWPTQKTPYISSPPKGRYATQKRVRSEDQSEDEDDDTSSQDGIKRHRQESPIAQIHQLSAHDTNNYDGTSAQDEQILPLMQDPYNRTVQQKICQAEGWAKIFQKHTRNADANVDTANNAEAKNGGTTKGTRPTVAPKITGAVKDPHKIATK